MILPEDRHDATVLKKSRYAQAGDQPQIYGMTKVVEERYHEGRTKRLTAVTYGYVSY